MTEPMNSATSATESPEQSEGGTETSTRAQKRQARRDEQVRGRLREVEAERDQLRQRYEGMLTAEVHRVLDGVVSDPAMMLQATGVTPASFLDEDGLVDPQAVKDFAEDFLRHHPGFRSGPPPVSGGHQRPVQRGELAQSGSSTSWIDVLKQRRS